MSDLLNMEGWIVNEVTEPTPHDYQVSATFLPEPLACIKCGAVGEFTRFGFWKQKIMDAPLNGKRVRILLKRRRYRCKTCRATFLQPLSEVDENREMTYRLVQYLHREMLTLKTFTSIAEDTGLSEGTIRNVCAASTAELYATRANPDDRPGYDVEVTCKMCGNHRLSRITGSADHAE